MNGRKVVRGFLWMMIVPLAVGLGLWAGSAWSQQPRELTASEVSAAMEAVKGQRDFAQEQAMRANVSAQQLGERAKGFEAEIDRLKKLCGAVCEPKKEEKK